NSLNWSRNDDDDEMIPIVLVVSQKEVRWRIHGRKSVVVMETSWALISGYRQQNKTRHGDGASSTIAEDLK
ncbi:hypothetical protein PanWU01x14_164740, partial [Parasponia andersonii]